MLVVEGFVNHKFLTSLPIIDLFLIIIFDHLYCLIYFDSILLFPALNTSTVPFMPIIVVMLKVVATIINQLMIYFA